MDEVTFQGLRLLTSLGRVMTPRPATERLVTAARAHVGQEASRVVDVGTGSGAVAVAIASACPHAEVWATDVSAEAVALARRNACRQGLGDRVTFRCGDLLDPVPGRFDVIAANLPYLPASAAADHPELASEPFDAVFAADDGLEPYRRLVEAADARMTDGGVLLLQLDRRVVTARRAQVPALQAGFAASASGEFPAAAAFERIAGKAA